VSEQYTSDTPEGAEILMSIRPRIGVEPTTAGAAEVERIVWSLADPEGHVLFQGQTKLRC
jgi:hypothetical protein